MTENNQEPQVDETGENLVAESNDPSIRIVELEAQLAEAQAAVLYVKADGENIRRRALDDIEKARKFALEKFSNELLAVKDSLDAALLIEATDAQSYKDGVQITPTNSLLYLINSILLKLIRSVKSLIQTSIRPSVCLIVIKSRIQ